MAPGIVPDTILAGSDGVLEIGDNDLLHLEHGAHCSFSLGIVIEQRNRFIELVMGSAVQCVELLTCKLERDVVLFAPSISIPAQGDLPA